MTSARLPVLPTPDSARQLICLRSMSARPWTAFPRLGLAAVLVAFAVVLPLPLPAAAVGRFAVPFAADALPLAGVDFCVVDLAGADVLAVLLPFPVVAVLPLPLTGVAVLPLPLAGVLPFVLAVAVL